MIMKRRLFLKKAVILSLLPSFMLKLFSNKFHVKNGWILSEDDI